MTMQRDATHLQILYTCPLEINCDFGFLQIDITTSTHISAHGSSLHMNADNELSGASFFNSEEGSNAEMLVRLNHKLYTAEKDKLTLSIQFKVLHSIHCYLLCKRGQGSQRLGPISCTELPNFSKEGLSRTCLLLSQAQVIFHQPLDVHVSDDRCVFGIFWMVGMNEEGREGEGGMCQGRGWQEEKLRGMKCL